MLLICYHFIEMLLAPCDKCHDGWHERLASVGQRILNSWWNFRIDLTMHQMREGNEEEVAYVMGKLIKEGKIRAWG